MIFKNRDDLIRGSQIVVDAFACFGMEVHLGTTDATGTKQKSKTEALFIPAKEYSEEERAALTADYAVTENTHISFCDSFKYLGSIISSDLTDDTDIEHRIRVARGLLARLKPILRNRRISREIRVRIYKQLVITTLLWGCESWALKHEHRKRLQRLHHDAARMILRTTRWIHMAKGVKMRTLLEILQLEPISWIMRKRRMGFLHKLTAQPEESMYRRLMFCQAEGELTRGRNKMSTAASYAEDLKKYDVVISQTPYLETWIGRFSELAKSVAFDWVRIEGELL